MRRKPKDIHHTLASMSFYFLLLAFSSTAQAACYFPSGRLSPNDTPCRDDTAHAVCCGQGYACLTNGLCQATGQELQKPGASEYVRGGCTDKSFRSSSCPSVCIDPELDNVAGGHGLGKCADPRFDMYYCINEDLENVNCTSGEGTVFFAGEPSVITVIGVAETTSVASETSSEPTDSETETTTTAEATLSTSASADTTSSGPARESATSPPPSGENETGSSNQGALIGGVVGGVAAAIVFAAAGWWFWRRKRKQTSQAMATHSQSQHSQHVHRNFSSGDWKTAPVYEAPGAAHVQQQPMYEAPGSEGTWTNYVYEAPGTESGWRRPAY